MIKIIIEIDSKMIEQLGDEVKPKMTIIRAGKAPQTPSLNDTGSQYQYRTLDTFSPSLEHGGVGNRNAAKKYRQGRKIHTCFRCGAPHRHNNLAKGGCVECRGVSDEELAAQLPLYRWSV